MEAGRRSAAGACCAHRNRRCPPVPAAKDTAPSYHHFHPLPADGLCWGQRDGVVLLPPSNISCLQLSQVQPGIGERDLPLATSISLTAPAPCITRSAPAISLWLEESRCEDRKDGKGCKSSPAPGMTQRRVCPLCPGTRVCPRPALGPLWTIPTGRGELCLGSAGPSTLSVLTIARKSWLLPAPRILGSPAHHPQHKSN